MSPRRVVSDSDRDEMAALYWGGLTLSEIGRQTGWSTHCVRNHLLDMGIHKPLRPTEISESDILEMAKMRRRRCSYDEIGERFGIAPTTARLHLVSAGFENEKPSPRELRLPKMTEMYESGSSLEEIAAEFGIHPQTARRQLRDSGIWQPQHPELRTSHVLRMIDLFVEGHSVPEIAAQMGIGPRPVRNHLRDAGYEIKSRWTEESIREPMMRMYAIGWSRKKMAYRLKLSSTQVDYWLGRFGLTLARGRVSQQEIDRMVSMRRSGNTVMEICAETGRCRTTVSKYLEANGVLSGVTIREIEHPWNRPLPKRNHYHYY